MQTLVITPKTKAQFKLLADLLAEMNIKAMVLSEEEKEALGLLKLMEEADRSKTVSKETIMKKLSGK